MTAVGVGFGNGRLANQQFVFSKVASVILEELDELAPDQFNQFSGAAGKLGFTPDAVEIWIGVHQSRPVGSISLSSFVIECGVVHATVVVVGKGLMEENCVF